MTKQRVTQQAREWCRLARRKSRRDFLKAGGAAGAVALAGCSGGSGGGSGTTTGSGGGTTVNGTTTSSLSDSMTIFHAGSLEPPFGAAEPKFEQKYGVDVTREAKGSVASTKKITQQGRVADVLGVSDYRLIRDRVIPDYGSWYAIFQTNAMVVLYTADSKGAGDISKDNWWEVLTRDGVTIGHADPAVDPGGYRSVMAQQLGKYEFEGSKLYGDATYKKLRDNSVVPTGTETKLVGQLESGKLDYAFNYRSVGTTADVQMQTLQPQVDLSKANQKYANHYAKAKVKTDSGTFTGAPIAYGMTVPSVAEAPGLGARWVEYMLSDAGRTIERNKGFVPVEPAVVPASGEDSVPARIMDHAEARSSLGPLKL